MPVLEDAQNNSLCHNHMITMAMGQWMIFKTYKMADNGESVDKNSCLLSIYRSFYFVLVTIN